MTRPHAEMPCVRGCLYPESTPEEPRPRPAKHGFLCRKCYYATERAIAELPSQRDDLADMLRGRSGGSSGYVTGSPAFPLPIDTRVADHRERIRDVLTSWARMVAEERQEVGALSPHPTVTATYLGSRLDWCAEQPWIDDLCNEMAELRGRAFGLLYPHGRRQIKAGRCPMDGCEGVLTATLADKDDRMSSVDCDEDPAHSWDSMQWMRLGHRIAAKRPAEDDELSDDEGRRLLDQHWPRRGPCLVCGTDGYDQRHRVLDAVWEQMRAGESPEQVAETYGWPVELAEWLARQPSDEIDRLGRAAMTGRREGAA